METEPNLRDHIECKKHLRQFFEWLGNTIHPNQISAIRLLFAIPVVATHQQNPIAGAAVAAFADIIDWLDGAAARATGKTSVEGAMLDPLVDKLMHGFEMGYLAMTIDDLWLRVSMATDIIAANGYSTMQRGNPIEQLINGTRAVLDPTICTADNGNGDGDGNKANWLGKSKFVLESATIIMLLAGGQNERIRRVCTGMLFTSSVLGFLGTRKRIRETLKHVPQNPEPHSET
jgi:phosphatidylglycerophosphate synthase